MSALTPSQAVARSVKRARKLADMNQQDLAERLTELGIPTTQSTIARLERGRRGISLDDAVALSIALNVSLSRLIGGQAVEDDEIAMSPKCVCEAELARLHVAGRFRMGWNPDLNWWKSKHEEAHDSERFERAQREGRLVKTETADDGTTTYTYAIEEHYHIIEGTDGE